MDGSGRVGVAGKGGGLLGSNEFCAALGPDVSAHRPSDLHAKILVAP